MISRIDISKSESTLVISFSTNLCIPNGDLVFDMDESIHFEKHKFIIHL